MASESSSPVWQPTAVRVVTLLDARTGTMPCCGSAPLHQSLDTRTDAAPFRGTVRLPKSPDPSLLYVAAGSLALHDEAGAPWTRARFYCRPSTDPCAAMRAPTRLERRLRYGALRSPSTPRSR